MVDSLANAAGAATTWTGPDNRVYKIKPLTLGDLASLEAWVKSEKLRAFLAATVDLDPVIRQGALVELAGAAPGESEVSSGMQSIAGTRYLLWLTLKKTQADMTLDDVDKLVTADNLEEVATIVQKIGGLSSVDPTLAPATAAMAESNATP